MVFSDYSRHCFTSTVDNKDSIDLFFVFLIVLSITTTPAHEPKLSLNKPIFRPISQNLRATTRATIDIIRNKPQSMVRQPLYLMCWCLVDLKTNLCHVLSSGDSKFLKILSKNASNKNHSREVSSVLEKLRTVEEPSSLKK